MAFTASSQATLVDLEYDVEGTVWRSAELDRGTALLQILNREFKGAVREMHRHVILRNALRRPQNLAQILLFVGFGGGFSEILPVDDIFAEVVKEGAAGDGNIQILCQWSLDRDGRHVFPHQPGRMNEVKRLLKMEDLRHQASNLISWVDDCADEADRMGGTWLKRRQDEVTLRLPRATRPAIFQNR